MSETCIHWWLIESPGGRTSHGVCKYCGAEADFLNSLFAKGETGFVPGKLVNVMPTKKRKPKTNRRRER